MKRDIPAIARGYAVPGDRPHPLARFHGERPPAPAWFTTAMAIPVEERRVTVDGAGLETLAWGDPANQGLLLAHGSMAHARWWQPVAQLLARHYRVVSFSFSGTGGSDRRPAYSIRQMAGDMLGVADATGLFAAGRHPAFVAHSFGGKAAGLIAGDAGERLLGTVLVDAFTMPEAMGEPPPYRARFYPSQAAALERFRFSPDEPGEPYIIDAIARAAMVEQDDGQWTWRFDPDYFAKCAIENEWESFIASRCPLAFIRGQHSTIQFAEDFVLLRQVMRPDTVLLEIPDCHHHIMAQQPIALACTIAAVIEGWRARAPDLPSWPTTG